MKKILFKLLFSRCIKKVFEFVLIFFSIFISGSLQSLLFLYCVECFYEL